MTGRTGSGCSTVANLFTSDFDELKAPQPKRNSYNGKEDRSYAVLYDYVKDERWKKFTIIRASTVILSFILEKSFDEFKNYIVTFFVEEDLKNKIEDQRTLLVQLFSLIQLVKIILHK